MIGICLFFLAAERATLEQSAVWYNELEPAYLLVRVPFHLFEITLDLEQVVRDCESNRRAVP
jgi:hypothetical protein